MEVEREKDEGEREWEEKEEIGMEEGEELNEKVE